MMKTSVRKLPLPVFPVLLASMALAQSTLGAPLKVCSQVAVVISTSAIRSATESSSATGTATGLTTSDTVSSTSSVHITGVTGFTPSTNGILTIDIWPTANSINASYINNTSGASRPLR